MSTNFAMVGAAGFVAPRHLRAILDTGNKLVAAIDPNDSVGVLDRYFPDCKFFTEIERFDRHLEKLKRQGEADRVRFVSICSPNYLHDAHVRLALRIGADAICEKPLVINPWNIDALSEIEEETGHRVWNVLQLRYLPILIELRAKVQSSSQNGGKHKVNLSYITKRGNWYHVSWKGGSEKSGGIAMNIGIHFFDMLQWIFGPCEDSSVFIHEPSRMGGKLELSRATVNWFLSIDQADLPAATVAEGKPAYRSMTIDGHSFEFSDGFTDLHTKVYENVLAGRGFGLEDARPGIEIVHALRQRTVSTPTADFNNFLGR